MSILRIPAGARHFRDEGWLKTHRLFSFADYHDPANMEWGQARIAGEERLELVTEAGADVVLVDLPN